MTPLWKEIIGAAQTVIPSFSQPRAMQGLAGALLSILMGCATDLDRRIDPSIKENPELYRQFYTSYWHRPYYPQYKARDLTTDQPNLFDTAQPNRVELWPNHHTEILTTHPQSVQISSSDIRLVNLPGTKATSFGIFLPTALVAAFGYNPSLENAELIIEIAPNSSVNTIALKLSPIEMSLKYLRGDYGSNANKITDLHEFSQSGARLVFPLKQFYETHSAPHWKLTDEGGMLMVLSGVNVARTHEQLQKTGEKPSVLDLLFNPRFVAIGEHGAYVRNEPGTEITITRISIFFPISPDPPTTLSEQEKRANVQRYQQILQQRKEELIALGGRAVSSTSTQPSVRRPSRTNTDAIQTAP